MGCIQSSESTTTDDGGTSAVVGTTSGRQTRVFHDGGEVYVFLPGLRLPKSVDLAVALQDSISSSLAAKLNSLRSRVVQASGAEEPASKSRRRKSQPGSDNVDLERTLEDYLPVLLGMISSGEQVCTAVKFEWTNREDGKKESMLASAYYELLSVLHLMGSVALQEANTCLTPRPPAEGYIAKVSDENKRNAIEILLRVASFLECALSVVLPLCPADIKAKLPIDLSEGVMRSMEQQALGQGVEIQLGLAIDNVKASLAVKRRLACEQVKYWLQAYEKISTVSLEHNWGPKHLLFVRWKHLEAKAAAYYYHALVLDEGLEEENHGQAVACFLTADKFLRESQKIRFDFCNCAPVTRVPPVWGSMKYLNEKIPKHAISKTRGKVQVHGRETVPASVPELPDFPLALKAESYVLPPVDAAWESESCYDPKHRPLRTDPDFLIKKVHEALPLVGMDLRRQPGLAMPEYLKAR